MSENSKASRAAHTLLYLIPLYIGFMVMTRSFFHQAAFFLLVLTFITFSIYFIGNKLKQEGKSVSEVETSLFFICLFSIIFSLFLVKGLYQNDGPFLQLNYFFVILSILILSTYKLSPGNISLLAKSRFFVLLSLNILVRIFLIIGSPNPVIDVFDSLKRGPEALLQLQNPYDYQYSQVYRTQAALTYYPYPPASLLFLVPISLLFKDPRYLFVITEILTAFLFYKMLKKNNVSQKTSELIPSLYLFFPLSFFILEQSWLDPLANFLIVAFTYLTCFFKRLNLAPAIIMGLIMTTKQYLIIMPLFFLRNWKRYKKILLWSLLAVVTILFPFYLAGPNDFNVYRLNYTFRFDALTLTSFLYQNFKITIPRVVIFLAWIILVSIIFLKRPREIFENYMAMSYWFLGFFMFGFIAFINEYYLSYTLLILTYVISFKKKGGH